MKKKNSILFNKNNILNQWKNDLLINKKQRILIDIEHLINHLNNEKSLNKMLIKYFVVKEEDYDYYEKNLTNYSFRKSLSETANIRFNEFTIFLQNKNPLIFNLKLYMPKFSELDIKVLIIWIYKVEIKQEKLLKDNKKQFFYLIYNFQKEENEEKKIQLFINLLKKMQLYIKYKN